MKRKQKKTMKNGKIENKISLKTKKTVKKSRISEKNATRRKNTSSSTKKKDEKTFNVHIRMVKLTKECRKRLKKVKDSIWGNVADAIECGDWYIPVKNHDYEHMKDRFENGTKDFFNLEQDVCVEDFMTDIICYN